MFDTSLSSANFWFDLSNVALLIGAILVALGTFGVFKTGAIKEKFSDERISGNEKETAKAKAEASTANENTEIIRKANIVLQKELETEKFARLKLEGKVAARHLTADQKSTIIDAVKKFAGQAIDLSNPIGDSEAQSYALELEAAFTGAGLKVIGHENAYISTPRGIIITIGQSDLAAAPSLASALREALMSLGMLQGATVAKEAASGTVSLTVGAKPE